MNAAGDPLRSWFKSFLDQHGAAAVETEGDLEAVLPPELLSRTGWSDFERFSFQPGGTGRLVSYHSDVLQTLRPLIDASPLMAAVTLSVRSHPRDGLDALIRDRFSFENGVCRYQGRTEAGAPYLLGYFRATAVSEEKRERIIAVVLNTRTGIPVGDLAHHLSSRLAEDRDVVPASWSGFDPRPWRDRLTRLALGLAPGLFLDFQKSLGRRLARDVHRLREYYTAIETEIKRKIHRKVLVGEAAAREEARIEATRREMDRKIADQHARYAMTIRIEPLGLLVATLPATSLDLKIQRRTKTRRVEWTYNQILKEIEPPACEACLTSIRRIHLCDEAVHLLCASCSSCPNCGREWCRVCRPRACGRCGMTAAIP